MNAQDDNQVLSQAEIDAMLGNAGAGSELDDPLMAAPAPAPSARPEPEQPQVVWSTGSPEAPLVPAEAPREAPAPEEGAGRDAGARRGLFRKILGKSPGPSAESAHATTAPPRAAVQPPAERPRPALDIEEDLAAADPGPDPDPLGAPQSAAVLEPDATPSAAPLDSVADVMSVFLEDEGMDPVLRRLVERVPEVRAEDLLSELREVCALLGVRLDESRSERAA